MNDIPDILLLWTDIETTGLDYNHDLILEMAWQITDYAGVPATEPESMLTIASNDEERIIKVLERYREADPYVQQMHLSNGLWNEVVFDVPTGRHSRDRLDIVIERMIDAVDDAREVSETEVRFAGSSVGFDKRFIEIAYGAELPGISHRVHDLSTIKPLLLWHGIDINNYTADWDTNSHRALRDVERDVHQWQQLVKSIEIKAY